MCCDLIGICRANYSRLGMGFFCLIKILHCKPQLCNHELLKREVRMQCMESVDNTSRSWYLAPVSSLDYKAIKVIMLVVHPILFNQRGRWVEHLHLCIANCAYASMECLL